MKNAILRPLITEKNTYRQNRNVYVFECATDATKLDIKSEVEKLFKVSVTKVNTIVTRHRTKRTKAGVGRVVYSKKAFVKLTAGQKIAVFEGV